MAHIFDPVWEDSNGVELPEKEFEVKTTYEVEGKGVVTTTYWDKDAATNCSYPVEPIADWETCFIGLEDLIAFAGKAAAHLLKQRDFKVGQPSKLLQVMDTCDKLHIIDKECVEI